MMQKAWNEYAVKNEDKFYYAPHLHAYQIQ